MLKICYNFLVPNSKFYIRFLSFYETALANVTPPRGIPIDNSGHIDLAIWPWLFTERHGKKGDSEEHDQEVPSHAEHHHQQQQQGSPGSQEVPQQQQQQGEALPEQQPPAALAADQYTAADMQQPPLAGSPSLPLYPDFDINSIFNIENIPGLSVSCYIIYLEKYPYIALLRSSHTNKDTT